MLVEVQEENNNDGGVSLIDENAELYWIAEEQRQKRQVEHDNGMDEFFES